MEIILIIVSSLLFIWLLVDETERIARRRHRSQRDWIGKCLKKIKHKNPDLVFNFSGLPVEISKKHRLRICKVMGWSERTVFTLRDIIALFPETIMVPEELQNNYMTLDGESKPIKYTLGFDSKLRPEYTKWGWEGADDTLPYSEYGDNEWFNDPENGGWKYARMKKPEDIVECYVEVLEMLVTYKLIKI